MCCRSESKRSACILWLRSVLWAAVLVALPLAASQPSPAQGESAPATPSRSTVSPIPRSIPPSDASGRRVRIADAGSLPGALNVFWLNGDNLHTVDFDRYLVAWKSDEEEFQTNLDGDRVKVVMGRNKDRVILEGLTNGTEYTVRVTHANAVGPAVYHSGEATATPAPRERELVSSFSQSPGIAKPALFSMRGAPGFLFGIVQFTTGPATSTLGSVTFLRFKPLHVDGRPRNLGVDLHLHEDDQGATGARIGTFVSPPEYVDGPAKFVAPDGGFALSPSTSYWLKLAMVEGEMHTYVTRHGEEDRTGQPGWSLLDDCRLASTDIWPYTRSCTTEFTLSHGPFVMSLNSPIESTLPLASITGSSAVEGENVEFTVELSKPTSATATVQYSTVDGSGDLPATTSDSDYTAVSGGTITFAVGETSKTIAIATGDDSTDENHERFIVRLSSPSANIALSELDSAAGVIVNNDQITSSDSTLAGIALTDGDGNAVTLNETFDPYRFVYTAEADSSVDAINMSVSLHSGVNPHNLRYFDAIGRVREGVNSADFARITPGRNLLKVLVTSDGRSQESLYTVMVTRTASSDATISTLILEDDDRDDIALTPAFSPSVTEYTGATTGPAPFYVDVDLNHGGADAEVSVNGRVVIPYSESYPADTFDMPAGQNTLAIEVTAEDGATRTYTFTLTTGPPLEVKFGGGPFSVDEGDSLSIPVILNQPAPSTLTIPLTATDLAHADADDYSISLSVEFLSGESETSAVFSAAADSVTDPGERVRLGFGTLPMGVSSANPTWAMVTINDVPAGTKQVNFEQSSYAVAEGGSVTVRVMLESAAAAQVNIPITATNQGGASSADYSAVPTDVTIAGGAREGSFTFTATEDSATDPDESVKFTLGSLPTGYTAGPTDETTVGIIDVITEGPQPNTGGGGGGGGGFGPAPVAPKFTDGFRTTRDLPENAKAEDPIGDPVEATHPDDLDITYSISGADAAHFTVDKQTGQLHMKDGMAPVMGNTYTVNLTATDSAGIGAIIIVVITVTEATHHVYDLDRSGTIERDEVVAAVKDYFDGLITKDDVIELLKMYFAESG